MFPALVPNNALRAKDYVFALRDGGQQKAWSLALFDGGAVVNGTLGDRSVVLIGDASRRTVRAYEAGDHMFTAHAADPDIVIADGGEWRVTEDALLGPDGNQLSRLAGHIAYWFAFNNYLRDAALVTE